MKLLVLGGTIFVGRHVVAAALEAGHEVSIFTRGHTKPWLFPEVEHLQGDRDGNLNALSGRSWDAVVDTSGYVPGIVRQSAEILQQRVGRYVFVSTVSVYADHSRPYSETSPVAEPADESTRDVWTKYGPLKAACERVVAEIYADRATSVRAGLIVGPDDPTNRFTYWTTRLAEGGDVLAPGNPDRPVQFIDVRDLAAWLVRLAEAGPAGAFNATGPATRLTLGEALGRISVAVGSAARLIWVDQQTLLDADVQPWGELPLWVAAPELAGLLEADVTLGLAAGLTLRPVEETALDTLAWARTAGEQRPTLTREKERAVLERWTALRSS